MARDFAPTFTPRYKVFYTVGSKKHSFQVRLHNEAVAADVTAMSTKIAQFLAALQPVMFADFSILMAKYAAENSTVFLPAVAPANPTGGIPVGFRTNNQHAHQCRFEGLGRFGSRVNISLYGLAYKLDSSVAGDYRIQSSEDGSISAAVTALSELAPHIHAIDTSEAVWYSYANIKPNDYQVRKLRG